MIRKTFFILVYSFLMLAYAGAQTKYPVQIMPNESKTFQSKTDTLWVLSNRQVKRAITDARQLKIELEISKTLRNKIELMNEKSLTKDSLILDLKKDRNFYMKNWNTCQEDVDLLISKQKRQKLFTRLSLGGVVVAFVAGFLIAK